MGNSDKKRFALLHIPTAESEDEKDKATTIPPAQTSSERPEGKEPGARTVLDADPATMTTATTTTNAGQENATEKALAATDTEPSNFLIRATQGHSIKSVDPAAYLERLSLTGTTENNTNNDNNSNNDTDNTNKPPLPDTVVHGTYHSAWPSILETGGLRCMSRNHVHFATGPSLESVLLGIKNTKASSETTNEKSSKQEQEQQREGNNKPMHTEDNNNSSNEKVISGIRRDAQVLIYINLRKALEADCPFWRSENGVILSEGVPVGNSGKGEEEGKKEGKGDYDDEGGQAVRVVPVEFFEVVVERREGLGVLWEQGREVQKLPPGLTSRKSPKGQEKRGGRGKG